VQTAKKEWVGESAWPGGKRVVILGGFSLGKKKKTDFAGKSVFF